MSMSKDEINVGLFDRVKQLQSERDELLAKYQSAINREHELELAQSTLKREASTWEQRFNEQTKLASEVITERDELIQLHSKALTERESTEREVEAMLSRAQNAERERDELSAKIHYVAGQLIEAQLDDGASPIEKMARRAVLLNNQNDELLAEVERMKADKSRIKIAAHVAIDYVGSANYPERIRDAHKTIDSATKGDK